MEMDTKQPRFSFLQRFFAVWFLVLVAVIVLVHRIPNVPSRSMAVFVAMFGISMLMIAGLQMFAKPKRNISSSKRILQWLGGSLMLLGIVGFLSGFFAALGLLNWIPQSVELPLGPIEGIAVDGKNQVYVANSFLDRVQIYDPNGGFVRGWFFDASGGSYRFRVNDLQQVEIAATRKRTLDTYDEFGSRLSTVRDESAFTRLPKIESAKAPDGTSWDALDTFLFPHVVGFRPGLKESVHIRIYWYHWLLMGPLPAWGFIFTGILILNFLGRKKRHKKPDAALIASTDAEKPMESEEAAEAQEAHRSKNRIGLVVGVCLGTVLLGILSGSSAVMKIGLVGLFAGFPLVFSGEILLGVKRLFEKRKGKGKLVYVELAMQIAAAVFLLCVVVGFVSSYFFKANPNKIPFVKYGLLSAIAIMLIPSMLGMFALAIGLVGSLLGFGRKKPSKP